MFGALEVNIVLSIAVLYFGVCGACELLVGFDLVDDASWVLEVVIVKIGIAPLVRVAVGIQLEAMVIVLLLIRMLTNFVSTPAFVCKLDGFPILDVEQKCLVLVFLG